MVGLLAIFFKSTYLKLSVITLTKVYLFCKYHNLNTDLFIPYQNAVNVLVILANFMPEVLVSNLEPEL